MSLLFTAYNMTKMYMQRAIVFELSLDLKKTINIKPTYTDTHTR